MNWKPTHYILIIENRLCTTCNTTYTALAHHTRVLLTRGTSSRTISIDEFASLLSMEHPYACFLPTLPRTIRDVSIPITSCPHCFHAHSELQIDFWPRPAPRNLSVAAIEASRKRDKADAAVAAIIPATLDAIPD